MAPAVPVPGLAHCLEGPDGLGGPPNRAVACRRSNLIFRTVVITPAISVPYNQPAFIASAVKSATIRPPKPPAPPQSGSSPAAKPIGTATGALTRSARRTHSAVNALTGTNSTP